MPETVTILGYKVFDGEKEFFNGVHKGVINTISPHSYIMAGRDNLFQRALLSSDYIIPDGIGIVLAARLLEGRKIRKIAGSDLHEVIVDALGKRGGSCFYLGSSEYTLRKITERIEKEHPGVRAGILSPAYKPVFDTTDNEAMIKTINDFCPDVLFIGMTAPKQEKWVHENRHRINAPLICSIGAVFDFYAGTVKRPGKIWIDSGLEWLPRLCREPSRLWRRTFISAPVFIWSVFFEKFKPKNLKVQE